MAEETEKTLTPEDAARLVEVEGSKDALVALIEDLASGSRRTRQLSAHVVALLAERKPELLVGYIDQLIDALYRPEAQTRWEVLDALSLLAPEHAKECGAAYDGAEAALFDEISAPLRLSAFRFLCVWGSTERRRSEKVWPIMDEAIQCFHGDLEYGNGAYLKARSREIYDMLVKRFKLEKPQKRVRVVKADDDDDEDEE